MSFVSLLISYMVLDKLLEDLSFYKIRIYINSYSPQRMPGSSHEEMHKKQIEGGLIHRELLKWVFSFVFYFPVLINSEFNIPA